MMDLDTLYYGDCLNWMEQWDDASVDLIYLDPPFNSSANYNILYGKQGGVKRSTVPSTTHGVGMTQQRNDFLVIKTQ